MPHIFVDNNPLIFNGLRFSKYSLDLLEIPGILPLMNIKEIKLGQVVRVKAGKVLLPTGALCVVVAINYGSNLISVTNAADLINKNLQGTEYPPSMFEAFDISPESAKNPFKVGDTVVLRNNLGGNYIEIKIQQMMGNDDSGTIIKAGHCWFDLKNQFKFIGVAKAAE